MSTVWRWRIASIAALFLALYFVRMWVGSGLHYWTTTGLIVLYGSFQSCKGFVEAKEQK